MALDNKNLSCFIPNDVSHIKALKKLLESKDDKGVPNANSDDLKKGYDELSDVIQKVGAEMYKQAGAPDHEAAPAGAAAEKDDTKVYEAGKKPIPDETPETPAEGEVVDKK